MNNLNTITRKVAPPLYFAVHKSKKAINDSSNVWKQYPMVILCKQVEGGFVNAITNKPIDHTNYSHAVSGYDVELLGFKTKLN